MVYFNSSKRINIVSFTIIFVLIFALLPSQQLFASGDQLLVTADSTYDMTVGTNFTVSVKAFISSTANPQTATGNVKYPTGQLRYVSAQPNGSGFGNPSITTSGSGLINFNASRSSTSKGIVKIFDITFQAVGAGTAIVEFTGDSRVNDAQTTYKSAVFRITNPAPSSTSPTPNTVPKPSPSTQATIAPVPVPVTPSSPTPTPSQNPDIAVLDPNGVVTNVNIDPDYTKGVITWKVTAPNPKSIVMYGSKSSDLSQQAPVSQKSDGTFSASIENLQPGVRYYFTITGSGSDNKNGTYSSTLTTNGYPVRFTVTENDIPANGAQIRINNVTKVTDTEGRVTIGLAEGEYSARVTTSTASLDVTVKVEKKTIPSDGSAPPAQAFPVNLTSSPLDQGPGSGTAILTFVGVLIGGTALIGIGFVAFMSYRRRKFETTYGNNPGTTVIIDDGYDWQNNSQAPNAPSGETSSIIPASQASAHNHRNNSVYIDDEEPLDMFAKKE